MGDEVSRPGSGSKIGPLYKEMNNPNICFILIPFATMGILCCDILSVDLLLN